MKTIDVLCCKNCLLSDDSWHWHHDTTLGKTCRLEPKRVNNKPDRLPSWCPLLKDYITLKTPPPWELTVEVGEICSCEWPPDVLKCCPCPICGGWIE